MQVDLSFPNLSDKMNQETKKTTKRLTCLLWLEQVELQCIRSPADFRVVSDARLVTSRL
jgi:hypothetical protein